MKKCPNCNAKYDDSWKVCIACKVQLVGAEEDRLMQLENQVKQILQEIKEIREGRPAAPQKAPAPSETKETLLPQPDLVQKEDTETKIGKYLLNKIGIISIVAGVAFFVAYTFRYLTPLHKILTSYFISTALLLAGIKIERNDAFKWYGRGMVGGGWLLIYFTTFAMYHISNTRILQSQLFDLILLALVVSGMITHLMKYRSQSVLVITLFMGYFTAGISQVTNFTFIYLVLLAVTGVSLAYKMNWYAVTLFSMAGTYLAHLVWIQPQIYLSPEKPLINPALFGLSLGFLAIYWVIYNIFNFIVKPDKDKDKKAIQAAILFNSFYFTIIGLMEFYKLYPDWRFTFMAITAVITASLALLSRYTLRIDYPVAPYLVSAIAIFSTALPFQIDIKLANLIWLTEIPLLIYISFLYKKTLYRALGWIIAFAMTVKLFMLMGVPNTQLVLFNKALSSRLCTVAMGILAFYIAKHLYLFYKPEIKSENETTASNLYVLFGTIFLGFLTWLEVQKQLVTLSWALGAFLLFTIGFLLKDKPFRYCAMGLVAVAIFRISIVDLAGLNTLYRIIIFIALGIVLMLVSFLYGRFRSAAKETEA